jgi:hypothetical protein
MQIGRMCMFVAMRTDFCQFSKLDAQRYDAIYSADHAVIVNVLDIMLIRARVS